MKRNRYVHQFAELIPEHLEQGVLYVSLTYSTTVHLCMCGCGHEVTNPLSPQQWKLIFDGRQVSLTPSVGSWGFDCESHYWLENGEVEWAPAWSRKRIAAGREATRRRIKEAIDDPPRRQPEPDSNTAKKSLWARTRSAVGRRT
ncbi:DUF6527 family protein [Aeromicrobium sp. Root495]|uniref:DUF6527 family protein n=1 Tax=Aeromicrobium sp. Root495 TaxID=1736550 RepID=UPI00191099D6|nr:DUF6527 family protein [Aeromicrobium sp. Root495]